MKATRVQLEDFVNAVAKTMLTVVDRADTYTTRRTCLECLHFDGENEVCKFAVANGAPATRPPAKIIAYGCDAFQLDNIPF